MTSEVSKNVALEAGLYIVSTPIGNLADITLRALDVLARADIVACEDTRVSRTLLDKHGIRTRCVSVHNYNEDARFDFLKSEIAIGKSVALISDAGTPLVSDPGYKLASRLRKAGFPVTAAPGPSAVLDALVLSGMPSDRFTFVGFVPAKPNEREQFLADLKNSDATVIFFETAHRLAPTLGTIADIFGERQIAIARELTKIYEDVRVGTAAELAAHYKSAPPKGEIVGLIHPAENVAAIDEGKTRKLLAKLLAHMNLPDASEIAAYVLGIPKNSAYDIGLGMK
ncbi:MAG: 16S rRNA (cytidine(1402)-2'-O)-methyltransferase, partial [Rickettsiales bacterium]|nr:16S rRNA (cytidine(1402)-2'-O)-methyltransferase [Rickettsiales bacterium]